MGRKRIDEKEKKIPVTIGIKKKYLDILKDRNINISELINKFLEKYLNM